MKTPSTRFVLGVVVLFHATMSSAVKVTGTQASQINYSVSYQQMYVTQQSKRFTNFGLLELEKVVVPQHGSRSLGHNRGIPPLISIL